MIKSQFKGNRLWEVQEHVGELKEPQLSVEEVKLFSLLRKFGCEFPMRVASLPIGNDDSNYKYALTGVLYVAMRLFEEMPTEEVDGKDLLKEFIIEYANMNFAKACVLLEKMKNQVFYKAIKIAMMYQGGNDLYVAAASRLAVECTKDYPFTDIVIKLLFQEAIAVGDVKIANLISQSTFLQEDICYVLLLSRYYIMRKEYQLAMKYLLKVITMEPRYETDRLLIHNASMELEQLMELFPDLMSQTISMLGDDAIGWGKD